MSITADEVRAAAMDNPDVGFTFARVVAANVALINAVHRQCTRPGFFAKMKIVPALFAARAVSRVLFFKVCGALHRRELDPADFHPFLEIVWDATLSIGNLGPEHAKIDYGSENAPTREYAHNLIMETEFPELHELQANRHAAVRGSASGARS